MPKNAKTLIALGLALIAVGVALASGLPGSVFSSEDAKAEPVQIDTAALVADFAVARQARMQRLLNSKRVLGIPRKHLDSIAECESHGDPKAIGGGGLYRGKYQFDRGTWASVGGHGDPRRAPELEQDRRAALLLKRSGSNPWPTCG